MSLRAILAFLAVVAVVGLLTFGLLSKGSSGVALDQAVPTKALPRLDGGGSESLAAYRGRWALVNFWSSWCIECRAEAGLLERFQRRYGGPHFTVVGIDTRDLSGDGRGFARRYGLTYPQLRDGDGAMARGFGTTGVPENFLIDPAGKLRLARRGPVTAAYLRRYVAPLLPGGKS